MSEKHKLDLVGHIRPLHLLTTLVMYAIGAGFARFLGTQIDPGLLVLGILWIAFLSVGLNFLGDYFQVPFDRGLPDRGGDGEDKLPASRIAKNEILLYVAAALLAGGALLTVFLIVAGRISTSLALVMIFFFLLYGSLIIPGLGLNQSGIGEFITSTVLVVLPPAAGYLLQVGVYHRFLTLAIFPLFPLHLGLILVLRLKTYAQDIQSRRKTLLVRLDWKRGIVVHNLMVLSGFLFFGFSLLFGMSFRIIAPVFFALPPAIYLIWILSGLENGAPVRWNLIRLLSLVVFFLPVYMIFYTAWFQ